MTKATAMIFYRALPQGTRRAVALGVLLALICLAYAAATVSNGAWLQDIFLSDGRLLSARFLDTSMLPSGYL